MVGVEEVVEVLGVEDRTVEDRMVEVRVVKVPEEAGDKVEVKEEEEETTVRGEQGVIQGTRPRDMLTNLPQRPATATGPSGSRLISAWSQGPAPGRSSGPPSPTTNDGPASPVKMTSLSKYTIICIRQIFQKYMPY